jgi:hypothetical protein
MPNEKVMAGPAALFAPFSLFLNIFSIYFQNALKFPKLVP